MATARRGTLGGMETVGRILGLDVGEARTGVALSDPMQVLASPSGTLAVSGDALADAQAVAACAATHEVVGIVVGLPLNQHGEPGPQAQKVLAFVEALRAATGVPLETIDERFTTTMAQRSLQAGGPRGSSKRARQRKAQVDQLAAAQILQTWLDRRAAAQRRAGE